MLELCRQAQRLLRAALLIQTSLHASATSHTMAPMALGRITMQLRRPVTHVSVVAAVGSLRRRCQAGKWCRPLLAKALHVPSFANGRSRRLL